MADRLRELGLAETGWVALAVASCLLQFGGLRWLLPILRLEARGKFGFQFWMAVKTLRIRTVVIVTPVAFFLEAGDQAGTATRANFFGNAVFRTPPRTVVTVRMLFTFRIIVTFAISVGHPCRVGIGLAAAGKKQAVRFLLALTARHYFRMTAWQAVS